jgi:hypothetical protein
MEKGPGWPLTPLAVAEHCGCHAPPRGGSAAYRLSLRREPLHDPLHDLPVPLATARGRHLPLLQLDGHAVERVAVALQFADDGRDLLGARLRLRMMVSSRVVRLPS